MLAVAQVAAWTEPGYRFRHQTTCPLRACHLATRPLRVRRIATCQLRTGHLATWPLRVRHLVTCPLRTCHLATCPLRACHLATCPLGTWRRPWPLPSWPKRLRKGPADVSGHVIGCHVTQETRVQNALDDIPGNICQVPAQGRAWQILLATSQDAM